MGAKQLSITTAHVSEYLVLAERVISWPIDIGAMLAREGLEKMDAIGILRSVGVSEYERGKLHGNEMVKMGRTCDEVAIEVRFRIDRIDTQSSKIIVVSVTRV